MVYASVRVHIVVGRGFPDAPMVLRCLWGATTRRAKPRLWLLPSCDAKGRERRFKTRFFFPQEKERFLESKEKGAPVRVEWSQIGIRRPVFTPPLKTSTVHR